MRTSSLAVLFVLFLAICSGIANAQAYSLPNVDSGCPANCRVIPWQAGSDIWNSGTLPVYGQVTCTPLNENGTTDDTTNINNCIAAAAAGTGSYSTCHAAGGCAVFLPAGIIFVNGTIRLQSNVVVRGAKPQGVVNGTTFLPTADGTATTIKLGAGAFITSQNFSFSSNLNPATSFNTFPSTFTLTGIPQKGDQTVTIGSGTVSVGTWIKVFGNDDPSLVNAQTGSLGQCQWCGDNTSWYVQQQMVQVTGINSGTGGAGSVVAISKPLYYTPDTTARTVGGHAEPAGAKYNIITFPTQKAGYENLRFDGSANDIGATPMIQLQGCLFCWLKNIETYATGTGSGSSHVMFLESYGNELRNSYTHDQRSGASGAGYGVDFFNINSDTKIENNVMRHNRHFLAYEGGGSGIAVLYNYMDDQYTDDTTYLGSGRTNHGAHPYMNLYEGNVISHIAADDFFGTSSHNVFWRNWLWGDETMNWSGTPTCPATGTLACTGTPDNGFDAIDLYQSQSYYSFVGNVLGTPPTTSIPTGVNNNCAITTTIARHANWSNATLTNSCASGSCGFDAPTSPGVYSYGNGQLGSAVTSAATIIRNGNYDYKTVGVAFWDGGSTNNTFATSLYYGSKPSFFGLCRWPIAGYDQSPVFGVNPAQAVFLGANITGNNPTLVKGNITGVSGNISIH